MERPLELSNAQAGSVLGWVNVQVWGVTQAFDPTFVYKQEYQSVFHIFFKLNQHSGSRGISLSTQLLYFEQFHQQYFSRLKILISQYLLQNDLVVQGDIPIKIFLVRASKT